MSLTIAYLLDRRIANVMTCRAHHMNTTSVICMSTARIPFRFYNATLSQNGTFNCCGRACLHWTPLPFDKRFGYLGRSHNSMEILSFRMWMSPASVFHQRNSNKRQFCREINRIDCEIVIHSAFGRAKYGHIERIPLEIAKSLAIR